MKNRDFWVVRWSYDLLSPNCQESWSSAEGQSSTELEGPCVSWKQFKKNINPVKIESSEEHRSSLSAFQQNKWPKKITYFTQNGNIKKIWYVNLPNRGNLVRTYRSMFERQGKKRIHTMSVRNESHGQNFRFFEKKIHFQTKSTSFVL